jgi:hypothetical protein
MAPERVRLVLDYLAAGLNPRRAARAAGVSHGFAYGLDRTMGGVYRPPGSTYSDRSAALTEDLHRLAAIAADARIADNAGRDRL